MLTTRKVVEELWQKPIFISSHDKNMVLMNTGRNLVTPNRPTPKLIEVAALIN